MLSKYGYKALNGRVMKKTRQINKSNTSIKCLTGTVFYFFKNTLYDLQFCQFEGTVYGDK